MKPNLRREFRQSMDGLHFSDQEKETMINMLNQEMTRKRSHGTKKLLVLALAAALLLVTLTGAAAFTRWSREAQHRYNPSQEIKEQTEKSGLSVMLEEKTTEPASGNILTATDQGITITAVQSIIDQHQGEITFRIEGFDLPEGRDPWAWLDMTDITIDGRSDFYTYMGGGFFDGTTYNDAGEWIYAETGEPVRSDDTGSVILDWTAQDGSMEYTIPFHFRDDFGDVEGKEIVVNFHAFGLQPETKTGEFLKQVEGSWELRWRLKQSADSISISPNAEIGDSGVILLTAEIGQKTIRTTYQLQEHWEGFDTLIPLPQAVSAVRMKDGSEHPCSITSEGYQSQEDRDSLIYFVDANMFDTILDISQVESLLFITGWEEDADGRPTIPIYDAIPIG